MGKTLIDAKLDWPNNSFDIELAERLCLEWNTNPPKHLNWKLFLRENVPVEKQVVDILYRLLSGDSPNAFTYFGPWTGRVIRKANTFT